MKKIILVLIVFAALLGLVGFIVWRQGEEVRQEDAELLRNRSDATSRTLYLCDDARSLDVAFFEEEGKAAVGLSHGDQVVMEMQEEDRYEGGGATFVREGDGAYVEEDGTRTYTNCQDVTEQYIDQL